MTNNQGMKLKKYHHINLDAEFVKDCQVWEVFF